MSKRQHERQVAELNAEITNLKSQLLEKDKDIKLQAIKLRELMHDEFRKTTIKKNYEELDKLASSPRV
jgi:hypothetical protein